MKHREAASAARHEYGGDKPESVDNLGQPVSGQAACGQLMPSTRGSRHP